MQSDHVEAGTALLKPTPTRDSRRLVPRAPRIELQLHGSAAVALARHNAPAFPCEPVTVTTRHAAASATDPRGTRAKPATRAAAARSEDLMRWWARPLCPGPADRARKRALKLGARARRQSFDPIPALDLPSAM